MTQHVRMHLEADPGRDAGALDPLGEAGATVPPSLKRK
jgi:hypothetical protein